MKLTFPLSALAWRLSPSPPVPCAVAGWIFEKLTAKIAMMDNNLKIRCLADMHILLCCDVFPQRAILGDDLL
jgi:hypothetical protein